MIALMRGHLRCQHLLGRQFLKSAPIVVWLILLGPVTTRAQAQTALNVKARGAKTFYTDDRAGNNQVSIFSESTLEDFTIVCDKVGGECKVDPANLESFKDWFSLRVEDLRTGIELRDRHMLGSEWLDAEKYPELVIKIESVQDVKKTSPNSASMTLIGNCTLHGVTNNVRISCSLAYLEESPQTLRRIKGDLIRLRANFNIKLSDYKIIGPPGSDFVGLRVSDNLAIKATIFGSTEKPLQPLKADKSESTTQPSTQAASQPLQPALPRRPPPNRPVKP